MKVEQNLILKQQQKLIITPMLKQALKILQIPALELQNLVQHELEENPFLEESTDSNEEDTVEAQTENADKTEKTEEISLEKSKKDEESTAENAEINFESESSDTGYIDPHYEEKANPENFISAPKTLSDHLLEQLIIMRISPEEYTIGKAIIGNIDNNGYLTCSIEEISQFEEISIEQTQKMLAIIQTFDPTGVGARTLQECLLIQIRIKKSAQKRDLAENIIKDHWCDFEKNHLHAIAKNLHIDISEVQKAVEVISKLEPKPGKTFTSETSRYIIPDVVVEKIEDNYIIRLNDDIIPNIRINRHYKNILNNKGAVSKESKEFIEKKFQSAIWILNGIEQRKKSLYKVAETIVASQQNFLEHGITHFKPLTLKEVANKVQLHESTVSRVTSNKYMQTPRGIFPFKFFFSGGFSNTGTEQTTSTRSVKELIKEMIEEENKNIPLTDQQISKLLAEKGISIARRTIAKYREELEIPSVSRRKIFSPSRNNINNK